VTPSAMTAAGRSATVRSRPAAASPPGHRRKLRHPPAPRAPRRVSGPGVGRTRPATAPRSNATLGAQALAVVRSLPDHSLLDRLVRGRAWIPVLGVLLAGIVAMQVEVLKLGTSIGRSIERSSTLQSQNELLQASVATLADDQRIERLAAGMGMVMPGPTAVAFLSARPDGSVGQALSNIHAPDPTGFAAALTAQLAASAAAASVGGATPSTPSQATPAPSATAGVAGSTPTPTASPSPVAAAPGQTSTSGAAAAAAQSPGFTGSATTTQGPATGAAAIGPPGSGQASSAAGG
jgi:hypothetical protein